MFGRRAIAGGRARRIALGRFVAAIVLAVLVALPGQFAAAAPNPFADLAAGDPAYTAVTELAARDIVRGYVCPNDPAARCFGPGDQSLRAQMAALIVRATALSGAGANPFTDRCDVTQGCIDDELWASVNTLVVQGVTRGTSPTTFSPHDFVLKQQVILFISRAKVAKGEWTLQPANAALYPGATADDKDARDLATYVFYSGAPPDAPTAFGQAWGDYASAATRGWFARALWQTYAKGTPVTEGDGTTNAAWVARVLELTNAERAKLPNGGCGTLVANTQLGVAAQSYARYLALQDWFAHDARVRNPKVDPLDNTSPGDRATMAGYRFSLLGENIAAGQASPEQVVAGWMNSLGHRENILNCDYTELGVGYYFLANDTGTVNYRHYWVQVFGRPLN